MRIGRGWLCGCLLLMLQSGFAGEVINEKFDRSLVTSNKNCRIRGGVLALDTQGKCVTMYSWNLPKITHGTFSFKVRRVKLYGREQHFGVILEGESGRSLMLYSRGNDIRCLEKAGGKEISNQKHGDIKPGLPSGPEATWTTFRVSVVDSVVEVNVNGALVTNFRMGGGSFTKVSIYAYRVDIEVDDFVVKSNSPVKISEANTGITPVFYAPFDDTLLATTQGGMQIKPEKAEFIQYAGGVYGSAVLIDSPLAEANRKGSRQSKPRTRLTYPAANMLETRGGTIMFWFSPGWDGRVKSGEKMPSYFMLRGIGKEGKNKFAIWLWHWLRADLPRKAGLKQVSVSRAIRSSFFRGDWLHIALAWDSSGWVRLFVNGVPYLHGDLWRKEAPRQFADLDFSGITRLAVGTAMNASKLMRNAGGRIDDLRIYNQALSDDAIVGEYRKAMPIDLLADDTVVVVGQDSRIRLRVAPGGFFVRPRVSSRTIKPVDVAMEFRLIQDADNKVYASKSIELRVEADQTIDIPIAVQEQGAYRLQCNVRYNGAVVQRTFPILVYAAPKTASVTDNDLELGTAIYAKTMKAEDAEKMLHEGDLRFHTGAPGSYLEAGPANGNRFGFEIPFPRTSWGKPVVIEFDWPDDKPRSMALYLYAKTNRRQHRDRLGGGIQSGQEYPLTGGMQKTRYIFYPALESYLFEARTMANRFPAAISRVTVYPVAGRLPKLKVRYPEGMPHRKLGHMDEDQTFDIMLNYDDVKEKASPFRSARITERLNDYLDYTGQELFAYPLLRYNYVLYPLVGSPARYGHYPRGSGQMPFVIKSLGRRGKSFLGILNLWTLPEVYLAPRKTEEFIARGYFVRDRKGVLLRMGKRGYLCNPVHPVIRKWFLQHIREVLERYGRMQGFDGVELWLLKNKMGTFAGLDTGYGDFTVNLFSRETGVKLPAPGTGNKYEARHQYLTTTARKQWLQWRADKVSALVSEVAKIVRECNPALRLFVALRGEGTTGSTRRETSEEFDPVQYYFEEQGVDVPRIASLPGVLLKPLRATNGYRWNMHWGRPEQVVDELQYDPGKVKGFTKNGVGYANSYAAYFETFRGSLMPKVYNSYFQNADVKPFGRYFLKEFAFLVGAMDAQQILIGAQPLGTWGRDQVTREFARAYCALPEKPFKQVAGLDDPVTVRYLRTARGTYLYAVSLLWSECTLELAVPGAGNIIDLSSGGVIKISANALSVRLAPYQLRSFLASGDEVVPVKGRLQVPVSTREYYRKQLARLHICLDAVQKAGKESSLYVARLERMDALLAGQRYAELHRLLFSKRMHNLGKLYDAYQQGFLREQVRMIAAGHYAVNCGSQEFYRSHSGLLFFPDKSFDVGKDYGYVGGCKTVQRDVVQIKNTKDPSLYATEAYDLDGYRFTVKPGKYTIRLYLKFGWKPSAMPGKFVTNVDVEGKRVFTDMDLFLEAGKDFDRAIIKEIKGVEVRDNFLDIVFSVPAGISPTARLCNAIEVLAE